MKTTLLSRHRLVGSQLQHKPFEDKSPDSARRMPRRVSPKAFLEKHSIGMPGKTGARRRRRVADCDFVVPRPKDYSCIEDCNYRVCQLKEICQTYKLRKGGNKDELSSRAYNYLRLSHYAAPIQRAGRRYLARLYVASRGELWQRPSSWTNREDCISLESWNNIPPTRYFTHKVRPGTVYGYDIASLSTYVQQAKVPSDPYTRERFTPDLLTRLGRAVRLGRMLGVCRDAPAQNDAAAAPDAPAPLPPVAQLANNLFSAMDAHDFYTSAQWLMDLPLAHLAHFVRLLQDAWHYRGDLSSDTRREICPPNGRPFSGVRAVELTDIELEDAQRIVLGIIAKLVTTGVSRERQYLGVCYVLGTLTLVSPAARSGCQWLYESFALPDNETG